ncbi:hypothetical protein JCM14076_17490 [Methylosoma difficile]
MKTLQRVEMPDGGFVAGTLVHTKQGLKPIELIRVGDWVLSKPESGEGEHAYKRVSKTFEYPDCEVWYLECRILDQQGRTLETELLVTTALHSFWVVRTSKWQGVNQWLSVDEIYDEITSIGGVCPNFKLSDGRFVQCYGCGPLVKVASAKEQIIVEKDLLVENLEEQFAIMYSGVDVGGGNAGVVLNFSVGKPGYILNSRERPIRLFAYENFEQLPIHFLRNVYNLEVEDNLTYYVGQMGVWVHNTNCPKP